MTFSFPIAPGEGGSSPASNSSRDLKVSWQDQDFPWSVAPWQDIEPLDWVELKEVEWIRDPHRSCALRSLIQLTPSPVGPNKDLFCFCIADGVYLSCTREQGTLQISLFGKRVCTLESALLARKKGSYREEGCFGFYLTEEQLLVFFSEDTGEVELFSCSYDREKGELQCAPWKCIHFFPPATEDLSRGNLVQIGGRAYYTKKETRGESIYLKELCFKDRAPQEIELKMISWEKGVLKRLVPTFCGAQPLFFVFAPHQRFPNYLESFQEKGGKAFARFPLSSPPQMTGAKLFDLTVETPCQGKWSCSVWSYQGPHSKAQQKEVERYDLSPLQAAHSDLLCTALFHDSQGCLKLLHILEGEDLSSLKEE